MLLHQAIDAVSHGCPERVAIVDGTREWSYGELRSASDSFAAHLVANGVKPGEVIGVHATRSFEAIVAMLGILKAGGGYVPLEPTYPPSRLTAMVEQARVRLAFTDGTGSPLPDVDLRPIAREVTDEVASCNVTGESTVYIVFTSGSTGVPKGIRITHANLMVFLRGMAEVVGTSESSRYLCRTTLAFDPHAMEIFLPLLYGGCVVLAPRSETFAPALLARAIDEHRVDFVWATPAIWRALLDARWRPRRPVIALCGGEPMSEELKNELVSLPELALWNAYGPTETTVFCTMLRMTSDRPARLGGALRGVELSIRDERGELVGEDETGELWIAGPCVAAGYLRADLTREAFVELPDGRHYKSGDVVRRMPDGTMEYLGRKDHQVKIRGFRVELREIEIAIERSTNVAQVVAIAENDERVIAFATPSEDADVDLLAETIRAKAAEQLPSYMVPAQVVIMRELPLTPNLKVDRAALARRLRDTQRAAATVVEQIWARVLGHGDFARDDRFIDVGGHSLNVLALHAQLRDAHGWSPPISELPSHTVATLEARLAGTRDIVAALRRSTTVAVKASPSQERLLRTARIEVERNNLELFVRIPRTVSEVADALATVIGHHDAFAIESIVRDGDDHVLRFGSARSVRRIDGNFTEAIHSSRESISLAEGRLFDAWVGADANGTHAYVIANHLIADGLSIDVVADELAQVLEGVPPPSSASFRDWLDEYGRESSLDGYAAERARWARQVGRSPIRWSSAQQDRVDLYTATRSVQLATTRSTRDRHDLVLAAAVRAASQLFKADEVPCRIVHGGRGLRAGLDDRNTVGWLAHHVPLWLPACSSSTATQTTLRELWGSFRDRGAGYGWLRYRNHDAALTSGMALEDFQLYFNYMLEPEPQALFERAPLPKCSTPASHEGIALLVHDRGDELRLEAVIDAARIDRSVVERFVDAAAGEL